MLELLNVETDLFFKKSFIIFRKKKLLNFFLLLKLIKPGVSGNSLRRATSECCHTDSSPVTGTQNQQPNTQVTQITFGEDESSCDSHTRWGKILIFGEEMRMFVVVFFLFLIFYCFY